MYLFRLFYHCSATLQAKTELSDRRLLLRLEDVCVPRARCVLCSVCVTPLSRDPGETTSYFHKNCSAIRALWNHSRQWQSLSLSPCACLFCVSWDWPLFFPLLFVPHFGPGTDFPALCILMPQCFGTGHCSSLIVCVPYSFWTGHCSPLIVCVPYSFWTGYCSSLCVRACADKRWRCTECEVSEWIADGRPAWVRITHSVNDLRKPWWYRIKRVSFLDNSANCYLFYPDCFSFWQRSLWGNMHPDFDMEHLTVDSLTQQFVWSRVIGWTEGTFVRLFRRKSRRSVCKPPEGRSWMSGVSLLSGISGLSFDSPFLSPLLFFSA